MLTVGTEGGETTKLGALIWVNCVDAAGPVMLFSEHETVTRASAASAALTIRRRIVFILIGGRPPGGRQLAKQIRDRKRIARRPGFGNSRFASFKLVTFPPATMIVMSQLPATIGKQGGDRSMQQGSA